MRIHFFDRKSKKQRTDFISNVRQLLINSKNILTSMRIRSLCHQKKIFPSGEYSIDGHLRCIDPLDPNWTRLMTVRRSEARRRSSADIRGALVNLCRVSISGKTKLRSAKSTTFCCASLVGQQIQIDSLKIPFLRFKKQFLWQRHGTSMIRSSVNFIFYQRRHSDLFDEPSHKSRKKIHSIVHFSPLIASTSDPPLSLAQIDSRIKKKTDCFSWQDK